MGDDEKQPQKSEGENEEEPINDPLVRTDVEAPREPFKQPDDA